jgi:hypothetical protein
VSRRFVGAGGGAGAGQNWHLLYRSKLIVDYKFRQKVALLLCTISNFFVEQPNGVCKPLFQILYQMFFCKSTG